MPKFTPMIRKKDWVPTKLFSTKTYGHICCGCSKTVSRDFTFEHPKYKGSVASRSAFFFKTLLSGQVSFICEDYLRFDSTGTGMMIKNIWNIGKKKSARAGNRLTITL